MTDLKKVRELYPDYRISELRGPRITTSDIKPYLEMSARSGRARIQLIGHSVQERPIFRVDVGHGERKVLAWTQMHGNEPTSTLAVLDFLNWVTSPEVKEWYDSVFNKCKLSIIPILNPDGAELFTRRNSAGVDINRDFNSRKAPETRVFLEQLGEIEPDLALNLHDQRVIFGGPEGQPATISVLSPSANPEQRDTPATLKSKSLIGSLTNALGDLVEFPFTKYRDDFYPGAFGDNLQKKGIPTVLIESGPSSNDPKRYLARELNFLSLIHILEKVAEGLSQNESDIELYDSLPFNIQNRFDIIVRDVLLGRNCIVDLGLLKTQEWIEGDLKTQWTVAEIGDLSGFHSEDSFQGSEFRLEKGKISIGKTIEFTKVKSHV